VGPDVVVGAHSIVAPRVSLRRTVVWPDARVTDDACDAIVTPSQHIQG
jgi:serine acetyltransferase